MNNNKIYIKKKINLLENIGKTVKNWVTAID